MDKCQTAIARAKQILISNKTGLALAELKSLVKDLKQCRSFNYARRMLEIATSLPMTADEHVFILQQHALCISKDVDLPTAERYARAMHILETPELNLPATTSQETLGITGGICKRRWETSGQDKFLEMALNYYERGYKQGILTDYGYCAINTAFVYDLLAEIESKEKKVIPEAQQRVVADWKAKADAIRKEIVEQLDPLVEKGEVNWWMLATLAEAKFGMGRFTEAESYLVLGMKDLHRPVSWELETTIRQLARLSTMHTKLTAAKMVDSPAWKVLTVLLEDKNNINALYTAFEGKIGLALSGGGFRASLYQVGMLARLAELDVLRKVEVLSCVSGGSIIGAHYYLEVRKLLEENADKDITPQHYVDIVKRIAEDFLNGVQKNLRTRVIADWNSNFKLMFYKDYTRTNKVGELYEEQIFSRIADDKQRWLNKLFIHPLKTDGTNDTGFTPKYDNWLRQAKVPVLILNATALNTGHNWQFTASWMGESPAAIQQIDGNYRLRRMYYNEAARTDQRGIKIGAAVAASSGVPGMFDPLVLPNLYEGKKVRLVDGGVHDNQGICGLLEQDCDVMMVSDASGQMGSEDDPANSILGVPMRANNILMERVRNAEYQDAKGRKESGLLKGLLFVHLKMELDVRAVDWIDCDNPQEKTQIPDDAKLTSYHIRKDLQAYLAAIRTDLDSFHDMEAHALMCSGYLMTKRYLPECIQVTTNEISRQWDFLDAMQADLQNLSLPQWKVDILKAGSLNAFKIWQLNGTLSMLAKLLKWTGLIALVALLLLGVFYWKDLSLVSVGQVSRIVLFIVLGLVLGKTVMGLLRYKQTVIQFILKLIIVTLGVFIAWFHLATFDRMYLKKGKQRKDK